MSSHPSRAARRAAVALLALLYATAAGLLAYLLTRNAATALTWAAIIGGSAAATFLGTRR